MAQDHSDAWPDRLIPGKPHRTSSLRRLRVFAPIALGRPAIIAPVQALYLFFALDWSKDRGFFFWIYKS